MGGVWLRAEGEWGTWWPGDPLTHPFWHLQNHEGVCPQESVYCENKCGARMMRRLLAQHATSECPKRTQPCTYCTKEFVFDTIQVRPFLSSGLWGT